MAIDFGAELDDYMKVTAQGRQSRQDQFEKEKFLKQLAIQEEQLNLQKQQNSREELGAPVDRAYKEALTKSSSIQSKYAEKVGPMQLRQQRLENQSKMIDIQNQKMNQGFMKGFFESYLEGGTEGADNFAYSTAGVDPKLAKKVKVSPRDLADVSYNNGQLSVDFRRPNEILKEVLDIQNAENTVKSNDPARKEAIELRKEMLAQDPIKDFIKIRTQVNYVDDFYQKYLNGDLESLVSLDQTLISSLNRTLEPDSVTREAEYLRSVLGSAVFNQLVANFTKLREGGEAIGPQERASIVQAMHLIANGRGKEFNTQIENYRGIAKKQDYDESLIFGEAYRPHVDYDTSAIVKNETNGKPKQVNKGSDSVDEGLIEAAFAPVRKKNG